MATSSVGLRQSSEMDDGMGLNSQGGSQALESAGDGEEPAARQRKRVQLREQSDIPQVRDDTGEKVQELFEQFLDEFTEDIPTDNRSSQMNTASSEHGGGLHYSYREQITLMPGYELNTLYVDYSHLASRKSVLARAIAEQYYRFLPFLRGAVQTLARKYIPTYLYTNAHSAATPSSGLTMRTFQVAFYNLPKVEGIRDLRTEKIGKLVCISGTVTRTSEVRPELVYGTFTCNECKNVISNVEQQFKYTEPTMCPNITCSNRTSWSLIIEQSKFADWQKVRIQENANEIPTGSMPRSLDVILRAEIVERAKAGDKSVFMGTFIVVPDVAALGLPGVNAEMMRESGGGRGTNQGMNLGVSGLKALGVKDLTYKTAFLACMVQNADAKTSGTNIRTDAAEGTPEESRLEYLNSLTGREMDELMDMAKSPTIYDRLVKSIAPTVYGHEIVKKGILLQLMGGVHKQTPEGMHLRGDLNVCVVGDPSTSKSQFLKYVCGFLPRAVYTSGKASSAAGLTAAVVKDEETGEFTIEAGALMLADNGICAIDEFDKMDISDQVAIHEAMEQQTISIAKAGIQATLNARTSILAAANPVGGRYNRKMTLRANVAMSAPIMSRFDLFFVVLDECNPKVDLSIAQHIVNIHRFQNLVINPEFSTDVLQRYIRYARTFNPKLTAAASQLMVEKYRDLRSDEGGNYGRSSYRVTVRQLESMVRLSEAIARAHCVEEITPEFVQEAYSLLSQSIIHVEKDDVDVDSDDEDPAAAADEFDEDDDDFDGDALIKATEDAEAAAAAGGATQSSQAAGSSPTANRGRKGETPAPKDGETPAPEATPAPAKKVKVSVSYDKYMKIMQMVVYHLADVERETSTGLKRSELAQWYVEQLEEGINTVEELEQEQTLIVKVLKKLVKEKYLLELQSTGEGLQEADHQEEEDANEPLLVVHPDLDLAA